MKIILTQDIKSLGREGDIKDVSEGYARNFLFPKKLAEIATDSAIKNIEIKKEKERAEEAKNADRTRQLAATLKEKEIVIKSKEKKGKLFGSVSKKDIVVSLQKDGISISEDKIVLENPIKKIGEYAIEIRLASDISAKIKLIITGA